MGQEGSCSGSSMIASCISFILGRSHPLSSVSALLCCFAQFFHCVELLCFCALLCFLPCSVLCFTLFCSLSSSVLLCSVGLFCFVAKPCFLPCFAHKLSWLCFAYEYFGAWLFSYFGLPCVNFVHFPLVLLQALRCLAFARHLRSATRCF